MRSAPKPDGHKVSNGPTQLPKIVTRAPLMSISRRLQFLSLFFIKLHKKSHPKATLNMPGLKFFYSPLAVRKGVRVREIFLYAVVCCMKINYTERERNPYTPGSHPGLVLGFGGRIRGTINVGDWLKECMILKGKETIPKPFTQCPVLAEAKASLGRGKNVSNNLLCNSMARKGSPGRMMNRLISPELTKQSTTVSLTLN